MPVSEYHRVMDEPVETSLPDVTGMTLAELIASDDPEIVAAAQRVCDEIVRGLHVAEVTHWPYRERS